VRQVARLQHPRPAVGDVDDPVQQRAGEQRAGQLVQDRSLVPAVSARHSQCIGPVRRAQEQTLFRRLDHPLQRPLGPRPRLRPLDADGPAERQLGEPHRLDQVVAVALLEECDVLRIAVLRMESHTGRFRNDRINHVHVLDRRDAARQVRLAPLSHQRQIVREDGEEHVAEAVLPDHDAVGADLDRLRRPRNAGRARRGRAADGADRRRRQEQEDRFPSAHEASDVDDTVHREGSPPPPPASTPTYERQRRTIQRILPSSSGPLVFGRKGLWSVRGAKVNRFLAVGRRSGAGVRHRTTGGSSRPRHTRAYQTVTPWFSTAVGEHVPAVSAPS